MACVNSDGTLSPSGRALVAALEGNSATAEEVAGATGLALFRVRAGLRELVHANLVTVEGDLYRAAAKPTEAPDRADASRPGAR